MSLRAQAPLVGRRLTTSPTRRTFASMNAKSKGRKRTPRPNGATAVAREAPRGFLGSSDADLHAALRRDPSLRLYLESLRRAITRYFGSSAVAWIFAARDPSIRVHVWVPGVPYTAIATADSAFITGWLARHDRPDVLIVPRDPP